MEIFSKAGEFKIFYTEDTSLHNTRVKTIFSISVFLCATEVSDIGETPSGIFMQLKTFFIRPLSNIEWNAADCRGQTSNQIIIIGITMMDGNAVVVARFQNFSILSATLRTCF